MRRRSFLAGGMGAGALLLTGCDRRQAAPRTARELRIAIGGRPSLDPHKAAYLHDMQVAPALFKGLVGVDSSGALIPSLAESWNVAEDGLTYTFRMRKAAWSDGTAIKANDFVGSMARAFATATSNRLADGLMAMETAVARVAGRKAIQPLVVTALTEEVLQISLSEPLPALLGLLAHPALALVPQHAIKRFGEDWTDPDNIVVSGAFKPTPWGPENRIELVPNPSSWEADSLQLDRIFLLPVVDDDATFTGFRDGLLDIVADGAFPLKHFDALRQSAPQALRLEVGWNIASYIVNDKRLPFANPGVRRAMAMAIDRQLLLETLQLGTGAAPTAAMAPSTLPSYGLAIEPDWWTWPADQRLAEARRLLAEAGFNDGQPLDVLVSQSDSELERRRFMAVGQQWARVGIRARAVVLTREALETALAKGDFELVAQSVASSIDMPESFLARGLCDARPLNLSGYCNVEADRAFAAAIALPDVWARAQALKQAELLMVAETPLINLLTDVGRALVREDVQGWVDNPTGRHPLEKLSRGLAR